MTNKEKPLSETDLNGIIADLVGLNRKTVKKTPNTNNQPGSEYHEPKDNSKFLD